MIIYRVALRYVAFLSPKFMLFEAGFHVAWKTCTRIFSERNWGPQIMANTLGPEVVNKKTKRLKQIENDQLWYLAFVVYFQWKGKDNIYLKQNKEK